MIVLGAGLGGFLLRPATEPDTDSPSIVTLPATDSDEVTTVEAVIEETTTNRSASGEVLEDAAGELSILKEQLAQLETEREELPSDDLATAPVLVVELPSESELEMQHLRKKLQKTRGSAA